MSSEPAHKAASKKNLNGPASAETTSAPAAPIVTKGATKRPPANQNINSTLRMVIALCDATQTTPGELHELLGRKQDYKEHTCQIPVSNMAYKGALRVAIRHYMGSYEMDHPDARQNQEIKLNDRTNTVILNESAFIALRHVASNWPSDVAYVPKPPPPLNWIRKLLADPRIEELLKHRNQITGTSDTTTVTEDVQFGTENAGTVTREEYQDHITYGLRPHLHTLMTMMQGLDDAIRLLQLHPNNKIRIGEVVGQAGNVRTWLQEERREVLAEIGHAAHHAKKEHTMDADAVHWLTDVINALDENAIRTEIRICNQTQPVTAVRGSL